MKHLIVILSVMVSAGAVFGQESVMIKEPVEQCYQDLKTSVPQAVRWDDKQMLVVFDPLITSAAGNVQLVTRVFQEQNDTACKLVVGIDAPTSSPAWNAAGSNWLWRNAHLMKAKIESTMKAREKKAKK